MNNSCFIGNIHGVTTATNDAMPVWIDSACQLGTTSSSRRFKTKIEPMDRASEAILALKPVTNPATSITSHSARLNGTVDPHGLSTTVYFQYGRTISYGSRTPNQTKTGNNYQNVFANISGLIAGSAQLEMTRPTPQTVSNNQ